jgi:hypothetical protein
MSEIINSRQQRIEIMKGLVRRLHNGAAEERPCFEKNYLPGPPAVMWDKHDEVRQALRLTIESLQQVETLDAAEARACALLSLTPALDAVDEMVYKEERILFPTALNLLTEQELRIPPGSRARPRTCWTELRCCRMAWRRCSCSSL